MSNKDNLINGSINTIEKEINKETIKSIKPLKRAATDFLKTINNLTNSGLSNKNLAKLSKDKYLNLLSNVIQNAEDLLLNIKNDQKRINKEIENAEQNVKEIDDIIDACFKFQTAINKFLDIKQIIMTWITPDGEIYHLSLEYEEYLLRTRRFEDKKFNLPDITQSSIKKQLEEQKKDKIKRITKQRIKKGHQRQIYDLYKTMLDNQNTNKGNGNIEKRPAFYESYYQNKIKRIINNKEIEVSRKPDLFFAMTLDNNELNFKFVNNWGILREAYYAALMDDNATFDSDQNKQANKLYEEYIKKVDNKAGVLGGDVSVTNKDGITTTEYAVKTGSAKSQSFLQYFTIAKKIIALDSNTQFSKENFITMMQGKTEYINGVISDEVREHLEEDLEKNLGIQGVKIS